MAVSLRSYMGRDDLHFLAFVYENGDREVIIPKDLQT